MAQPKRLPSRGYIMRRLHYDQSSGLFTWKEPPPGPTKIGDRAGWRGSHGYIFIMLAGRNYRAHRLAWLYMTGDQPPEQIDHKDTNTDNNQWSNLRAANPSQNKTNAHRTRVNTSGLKGICYAKYARRWRAMIRKDGHLHNLGYFDTPEEAHAAYCSAAANLHGEFSRTT